MFKTKSSATELTFLKFIVPLNYHLQDTHKFVIDGLHLQVKHRVSKSTLQLTRKEMKYKID